MWLYTIVLLLFTAGPNVLRDSLHWWGHDCQWQGPWPRGRSAAYGKVCILLFNSCIKFHAKICVHCWNINRSRGGYCLCSPCTEQCSLSSKPIIASFVLRVLSTLFPGQIQYINDTSLLCTVPILSVAIFGCHSCLLRGQVTLVTLSLATCFLTFCLSFGYVCSAVGHVWECVLSMFDDMHARLWSVSSGSYYNLVVKRPSSKKQKQCPFFLYLL